MACEAFRERLTPFLDHELDPLASRAVEAHLEACPDCAGTVAEFQALRGQLLEELEYHRAPARLRAGLRRATGAERRPIRGAFGGWRWLSAAAGVVVVVGGIWWAAAWRPGSGSAALAHEVVSSHIRSLMADHLTDVASTDQHTVKPWFGGRLDFSPPVSDFAARGYPLIGGRLDYLGNHPVAALVYQHRKHLINVFLWPAVDEREAIAPAATERGFQVIRGAHAGMSVWVVSDLNASELGAFARMLTGSPGAH